MSSIISFVFMLALWAPVLAYIPLQIAALYLVWDQARWAVVVPIPIAVVVGAVTTGALLQDSNLWPCWMFAIVPLLDVYLIALMIARRETLEQRRIKRGLCPACAYPIGTSPVCTECGAALTL